MKLYQIFFKKNSDLNALFLHIDSDTYDSCRTVLSNIKNLLKPGVLVLFDEYLAYPNWENGEFFSMARILAPKTQ